jgi:hypothetical protein
MLELYLLIFCRIVTGLVFGISFGAKARDVSAFATTITRFGLIPSSASIPAALLFLAGELTVVVLIVLSGPWLAVGFVLATTLLLTFCVALASVLIRERRTSCNCFGASEKLVSIYDLWRNSGFILCTLVGCYTLARSSEIQGNVGMAGWLLSALAASVFIAIWTQLSEIAQLFHMN